MIFKGVGDGQPYPPHHLQDWSHIPPQMVRLDGLITTKATLDLQHLLAADSTFYGDIFCHIVEYRGERYLEDGLHRALRAALAGRPTVHGRVLVLPDNPAR